MIRNTSEHQLSCLLLSIIYYSTKKDQAVIFSTNKKTKKNIRTRQISKYIKRKGNEGRRVNKHKL